MIKLTAIIVTFAAALAPAAAADVMAVTTLERGRILTNADIDIYPAANEDPYTVRDAYIGKQLKRTVYAGSEITHMHLQEPILVQRNAMVTMTYQFGTLTIVTAGRALGAGSTGELVDVMNLESRKTVRALVTGPDRVTVP
ncbi:flagellar basal body P-ring formation chaperone FlgA [Aquisalinus flavus]|uniref:Flagella basal body P-ring formation protein FlgA n=1 Tax=Aquisalinus flavus TaxID=1526572 RepID=A0A8J2V3F8_9PROT|nr:flagellar basal body P-ring formation chaperone FlgA [Aquisalinus flavus]MBD0425905.1 flagellar basal body P-ring formation protein FlgA [Aquisalinus flavus]UNE48500.1 flagellar basal body P-ring formation protein FlgA [Aquisalinus flavus]GGD12351.1 hypothetical protein GCM10011342_21390 [Aquisalinus flavus]